MAYFSDIARRRCTRWAIMLCATAIVLAGAGTAGYYYAVRNTVDSAVDVDEQIRQRELTAKTLVSTYVDAVNSGDFQPLRAVASASAVEEAQSSTTGKLLNLVREKGPAVIGHFELTVVGVNEVGGLVTLGFGPAQSPNDWYSAFYHCARNGDSWKLSALKLLMR